MFCWFFRFVISNAADSGKRVDSVTRWHILSCPSCRQFHRSCQTIGRELRSEATAFPPASRDLTREILARLPRAQFNRPSRSKWAAVAAAACVAAVIWIGVTNGRREQTKPQTPPTYAIATPRIELPKTWTRVLETPLTSEVRHLSNDAQSSIRFVVACLDVRPAESRVPPQVE